MTRAVITSLPFTQDGNPANVVGPGSRNSVALDKEEAHG
jgi:hypothetical protein